MPTGNDWKIIVGMKDGKLTCKTFPKNHIPFAEARVDMLWQDKEIEWRDVNLRVAFKRGMDDGKIPE